METTTIERPAAKQLPRFVPVIFANGQDNDSPGLQAACDNEAVQFDDRVYEPGESIDIIGRTLLLEQTVTARDGGRHILIKDCYLLPGR